MVGSCTPPPIDPRGSAALSVCACKADDALCHYIITRTDLPLGFMAAQIVHAAGESVSTRVPDDTNAIVLSVPSELRLLAISERLTARGVEHALIREPDAPWNGQATAIGIPPTPRNCMRPHISDLPLLRERREAAT
jgi:peptidyl-tRNA hydrolase